MKKYLGIVKTLDRYMSGAHIMLLTKTYDDIEIMNEWFSLYPDCEHVVLDNTEELNSMFEIFMDYTPVSQEEKLEDEEVEAELERLRRSR